MEKLAILMNKKIANLEHVDGQISRIFVAHLVYYIKAAALDSLKGLIAFFTRSALAVFAEGITA
jgi:hypothetical protein